MIARFVSLLLGLLTVAAPAAAQIGRLLARPSQPAAESPERGHIRLPDPAGTYAYVPPSYRPGAPLVVFLHGAGDSGQHAIRRLAAMADAYGMIAVTPKSAARTWDIVANASAGPDGVWRLGDYGEDVGRIDAALTEVFKRYSIDPARIALAGFSDGATYALVLGTANGDLFRSIIAFSPGFVSRERPIGRPRVFVSHGKRDRVLTFPTTDRLIVPMLRAQKLDVTFRKFDGVHEVPGAVERAAFAWFLGPRPTDGARKAD